MTHDVAKRSTFRRATPDCSNTSERSFISASYTEAKELANVGIDYISSDGSLVDDYFSGSGSQASSVLQAVASENDSSRT